MAQQRMVSIGIGFEMTGEDELRASAANAVKKGLEPGLAAIERFNGQMGESFAKFAAAVDDQAKDVKRAYAVLETTSLGELQTQLKALAEAYQTMRDSGTASIEELAHAHETLVEKSRALVAAYEEQGKAGKDAAQETAQRLEEVKEAFAKLETMSLASLKDQLTELADAYTTLRDSGQASTDELAHAHDTLVEKSRALVASYKEQGSAGKDAANEVKQRLDDVKRAFSTLGTMSFGDLKGQLKTMAAAYKTLRDSGVATVEELANAHQHLVTRSRALVAAYKAQGDSITQATAGGKAGLNDLAAGFTQASHGAVALEASVTRAVTALLAITGLAHIWTSLSDAISGAEKASYKLERQVASANKEFAQVRNLEYWKSSLKEMGESLKIYSESELQAAGAKTIEFSKALGLSGEQMTKLMSRAAELSAGKVDLSEGVEKLTKAMRGESRAAYELGVVMKEGFIQEWYGTHQIFQTAWSDLTELQKVQVRYQYFLSQTENVNGRAARSTQTLTGAWKMLKAQVEDAVVGNKDLGQSMSQLAAFIVKNAGDIARMAGSFGSGVAAIGRFAQEYRGLLLLLGGQAVGLYAFSKLSAGFVGIINLGKSLAALDVAAPLVKFAAAAKAASAASAGMANGEAISGMAKLGDAATQSGSKMAAFASGSAQAVRGLAIGFAAALPAFLIWLHYHEQAAAAVEALGRSQDLQAKKLQEEKAYIADLNRVMGTEYVTIQEVIKAQQDGIITTEKYQAAKKRLADITRRGIDQERTEGKAAAKNYFDRAEGINQLIKQKEEMYRRSGATEQQMELASVALHRDALVQKKALMEEWVKNREEALRRALDKEKEFNEQLKQLDEKIATNKQEWGERIREASRQNMSEQSRWNDILLEANEHAARAREELSKGTEQGQKNAQTEIAKSAALFDRLNVAVKGVNGEIQRTAESGNSVRIDGLKKLQAIQEEVYQKQKDQLLKSKDDYKVYIEDIKKELEQLKANYKVMEVNIESKLDGPMLDAVKEELDDLTAPRTLWITVKKKYLANADDYMTKVESDGYDAIPAGHATGGHLPGYGGGDIIPARLEPGEFVVRKEAVRLFGPQFFYQLQSLAMRRPSWAGVMDSIPKTMDMNKFLPESVFRFAEGGLVPRMPSMPSSAAPSFPDLGTINLNVGGQTFQVMANVDVAKKLKEHLEREKLLRPQGAKKK